MQISNKDIPWQYFLKQILYEKSSDITAAEMFRRFFLILLIYKYISRIFCSCKIWWVNGSLLFNKRVHYKEEKEKRKIEKSDWKIKSTKKKLFFGNVKKCSFPQKLNNRIIFLICLLFNYSLDLYKHIREYNLTFNQSINSYDINS